MLMLLVLNWLTLLLQVCQRSLTWGHFKAQSVLLAEGLTLDLLQQQPCCRMEALFALLLWGGRWEVDTAT